MKRLLFFIGAYPLHQRVSLLFLLVIERLAFARLLSFFSEPFVESRRILGYVFDAHGSARNLGDGMEVSVLVNGVALKMLLRWGSSDFRVFEQIIVKEEYGELISLATRNNAEVRTVIDAGANIGCSALYFAAHFPQASVFSLEIDHDNFAQLSANAMANFPARILPLKRAVWVENGMVATTADNFDKREWSIKVSIEGDKKIQANTLHSLAKELGLTQIDILKIDIEGAELEIFERDLTLDAVLDMTAHIAMEVHAEDTSKILQKLSRHGFTTTKINESIFGVNRNIVGKGNLDLSRQL